MDGVTPVMNVGTPGDGWGGGCGAWLMWVHGFLNNWNCGAVASLS